MSDPLQPTDAPVDNADEFHDHEDETAVNTQEKPDELSLGHSVPSGDSGRDAITELPTSDYTSCLQSELAAPQRTRTFDSQHSMEHPQRGIKPSATFESQMSQFSNTSLDEHWAPQHILCLDGGGVRGYSTLLILQRLMEIIKRIEQNDPHPAKSSFDVHESHRHSTIAQNLWASEEEKKKHDGEFLPCHYFDYIFGTSTGGLIAILLGRLRLSVDEALRIYEDLAGEIFGHPRIFSVRGPIPWWRPKHSSKRYEKVLRELINNKTGREGPQEVRDGVFNSDLTFNSEPLMCRTVCVAYCNSGPVRQVPTLFRSYEHLTTNTSWERNPGPAHAIQVWKVARATSAAPTFFKRMNIDNFEFIDGAIGTNNCWTSSAACGALHAEI